jgi:hypothetical protein
MNHIVAYELLTDELSTYRSLVYEELRQLVDERTSRLVRGQDGTDYDVATTVSQSIRGDGSLCIRVFVGEATWGAPHDPISDMIVVSPSTLQSGAPLQ